MFELGREIDKRNPYSTYEMWTQSGNKSLRQSVHKCKMIGGDHFVGHSGYRSSNRTRIQNLETKTLCKLK